ncbi:hypothetical protein K1W69_16765 [Hoeflea sp. WL0058]|uniref:Uncharacterized protein n=1 Tax=Flavimaribacter sediminis TaxID=2865987 RepID=A0AAE2ZQ67_9HYPH|nr:hypothetical protein [Flavimaribacter sediminis]MBW8638851.1 hypothetical protein [Flavimaribacter sediminis]
MATDTNAASIAPSDGGDRLKALIAFCCGLLCIAAIWTVFEPSWSAKLAGGVLFVIFCVVCQSYFRLRERALLTIAALVTAIALWGADADGVQHVIEDLSRAAYLAAFMMLMTSLRAGANTSSSVVAIGSYLTSQPPGRRYIALHLGGHFMGVLLNFGAISLLGPLIKRGVDAASVVTPQLSEIRLRRQISALSRGFSWFNVWAPTAIAQAVVITTVPGARASVIAIAGVLMAIVLLGVGWAEDRLTGHRARQKLVRDGVPVPAVPPPDFPYAAIGRFLSVSAALVGLAWMIRHASGIPLVSGIMIAAVPVSILWLFVQCLENPAHPWPVFVNRARGVFTQSIPAGSPEAATLGLAGFIGILGASLVDHSWFAGSTFMDGVNPLLVYISVAAIIPLASCIGLPPMMAVTFVGGILVDMPGLGLQPSVLGLSLLIGWGLNLTGSPFSASSLVLYRVTGIPGTVHSWRWNGVFTILSWVVASIVILIVSAVV